MKINKYMNKIKINKYSIFSLIYSRPERQVRINDSDNKVFSPVFMNS